MLPTLSPAVMDIVRDLASLDAESQEAKQLMCFKLDHLFIWDKLRGRVLAVFLHNDRDFSGDRVQWLVPTDTPAFEVTHISCSEGKWLAVYGKKGLTCMKLPRRSIRTGRFVGGPACTSSAFDSIVTCHSVGVDERYFICSAPRIIVQQVEWHPDAVNDSHIVVLSSDNCIRIYNLDVDPQVAEQTVSLSEGSSLHTSRSVASDLFAESSVSVRASLGETAIAFAFAPPVFTEEEKEEILEREGQEGGGWLGSRHRMRPIFLLHGNGDVYCLLTGLGANKPEFRSIIGPLPMCPETEDNYSSGDATSILCLQPHLTCPPVIVIATSSGMLYHCLLLNKPELSSDGNLMEWSSSTFKDEASDITLFVYEQVEVELEINAAGEGRAQELDGDVRLLLHSDRTSSARYFCSHKLGIHSVGLPMITHLAEASRRPASDAKLLMPCDIQAAVVEHLMCTKTKSSDPAPVLGLAFAFPPPKLFCLLSDFQLEVISLLPPYFAQPPTLASESVGKDGSKTSSKKEPFDERVKKMLQKKTTLPMMKSKHNAADPSSKECLELLTRSTQILREEYMVRMEAVRHEIDRHAKALVAQKTSQLSVLRQLDSERNRLRDKAADLSERYEDLRDCSQSQTARVEAVLRRIQQQSPVMSDAELAMQAQLQEISRRTKDLMNTLEQIRAKEKYQRKQIGLRSKSTRPPPASGMAMADNQLSSIKDVLEKDDKEIIDMVKQLKGFKKDLGL